MIRFILRSLGLWILVAWVVFLIVVVVPWMIRQTP